MKYIPVTSLQDRIRSFMMDDIMMDAMQVHIDPVCGEEVDSTTKYIAYEFPYRFWKLHDEPVRPQPVRSLHVETHFFCSRHCLDIFNTDPDFYIGAEV